MIIIKTRNIKMIMRNNTTTRINLINIIISRTILRIESNINIKEAMTSRIKNNMFLKILKPILIKLINIK